MTRGEKAKALFEQGCNCSQAVFLAFEDKTGLDRDTALKLMAGFGGGFARMREICGAVSGMTAAISFFRASSDPDDRQAKADLYALLQKAIEEFRQENGSFICRELLSGQTGSGPVPEQRTAEFYKKRPCSELCRCAADIAEKYINE